MFSWQAASRALGQLSQDQWRIGPRLGLESVWFQRKEALVRFLAHVAYILAVVYILFVVAYILVFVGCVLYDFCFC